MRKIYIFLSTILAILILTSCNNEINIGDEIIKDGLIYEVVDVSDYRFDLPVYEKDSDSFWHGYYYIDMTLEEEYLPLKPYNLNNINDINKDMYRYYPYDNDQILDTSLPYTLLAYNIYYNYATTHQIDKALIIKGYTKDIKNDVVIPDSINGISVMALGYKSLANLNINSLNIERDLLILPYALSNVRINELNITPTYKELSTYLFSCAVSNSYINNININSFVSLGDAAIYNSQINNLSIYYIYSKYKLDTTMPEKYGLINIIKPLIYNSLINNINSNYLTKYNDIYYTANLYSDDCYPFYIPNIKVVNDYYININELALLNKCYYQNGNAYYYDYYLEQFKQQDVTIHVLNSEALTIKDNYLYKNDDKLQIRLLEITSNIKIEYLSLPNS